MQSTHGYISSSALTSDGSPASQECAWIITGLPGQVINITMVDFEPTKSSLTCPQLGIVKDLHDGNEVRICEISKRQQHLYTSSGRQVEITLGGLPGVDSMNSRFLIDYEGTSVICNV